MYRATISHFKRSSFINLSKVNFKLEKINLYSRISSYFYVPFVKNNFLALHHNYNTNDYKPIYNYTSNDNNKQNKTNDDHSNKQNEQNKQNENKNENKNPQQQMYGMMIYGVLSIIVSSYFMYKVISQASLQDLNWDLLKKEILEGNIKKISLNPEGTEAVVHFHDGKSKSMGIPNEQRFIEKLEGFQFDSNIKSTEYIPVTHTTLGFMGQLIGSILPLTILGIILLRYRRGSTGSNMGGMSSMQNSTHKVASLKDIKTKFSDVAGADEAKEEVEEFVSFLKNPEKYQKLGAKIPKGALLVGPPGTGKTLLAKAIAGESGVPFYSISGSDFMEMFVGVGPSRVRDLFKKARESSPCIIWIDEIDAIGRKRSTSSHGNDERENTLNQLLVEMDGFQTSTNVIVLAGTNRADVLDSALLRPGRFDRQISVDAPDIKGRKEIFDVHLKKLTLAEDSENYSKRLAALTPSMTGAEIANIVNEGALIAARNDKEFVEFIDFENAIERVIAGLERKSRILSIEEKTRVAYHEAGHAIAGWFLKHAYPLLKVSIVPRGIGALGYAQYQPKDQNLYSTEQLDHQICTLLAGRASEEIKFNNISTGARDDIEKVTQIIYSQLISYGMNKKIGNLAFPNESGHIKKSFSEETAELIDSEAQLMVNTAYDKTIELLKSKYELVEIVAQHLLKHEVLKRDEMQNLVGPRPFAEVTTYEEMLGEANTIKE